ncbi:MAG: pyridoxal phosphate-dependent aminotransferase [Gammaproteobacteria bacterium]|nr:pyridoxal phosphate-dependent aminotransferase [Gammaproteobacteria bacterium]
MNKQQKLQVAARMAVIEPFHVMDLLAKARQMESQGRSIIHMEIGEPDFVTPQPVVEAGIKALREGYTHYTPAVGLPALRQAIARHYQEVYQVSVAPECIVLTPGASGALLLILGVLINPGDQVLMTDPGYPCNRHFVRLMEGEAVGIPVDASTRYQLTAELLQRHWTPKTRAVMLASPANPTGAVIPAKQLQQLIEFVEQQGAYLIMDEIYHGLVYGPPASTAAGRSENVLVINSFSKYFTMTGWRLGWLVAPKSLVRDIDKLAQNIFLAPATVSQYAALAAFSPDTIQVLEQRRAEFKQRRDYLLPQLRQLGFDIPIEPEGAFYLYAGCSRFTDDSYEFCETLLQQAGVAVTPGIDFGHHSPQNHVRFAYTTSMENLQEGISRIGAFLQQNGAN